MASGVVKALQDERKALEDEITTLKNEWDGRPFDADAKHRWNQLNERLQEYETKIELRIRDERLEEIKTRADDSRTLEAPNMRRPGAVEDALIYDISTVQHDFMNPESTGRELKDRALKAVEKVEMRNGRVSTEDAQSRIDYLLRNVDGEDGRIARHLLVTGSPAYKSAFRKMLSGSWLTPEENQALNYSRAMSLTGTSGGFAVPFELDPSIIPTSNLAINPYRSIARVVNITVDEWRGVSSAGVTAAYAAEATAATDAAPTLAQPTISTEKARAFIPFSIEIGQDWGSLQAEMGGLLADSKDELEATKFTLGNGTNEPFGVITGATTVFTAAGTNTLSVADIFGWSAALGPRFRPRSTFVMQIAVANAIRRFDTAGGASLWVDNLQTGLATTDVPSPGAYKATLLGRPAYESSAMSGTFTTGQLIGVYGDFSYYVIVDRIGMNIEVIPHLFDVTNNMPTGQRGLYAYWRNGAKVVDANAFRTLKLA
jgi:HK97 family phage major capsid protein